MHPKLEETANIVRKSPMEVRIGAVAGLVLLWAYGLTLVAMAERWLTEARYSHGFLVLGFAIFLLWVRRALLPSLPLQGRWWGMSLVLAGLAMRAAGTYIYNEWLASVSLLPCLLGLSVLIGGVPLLRWAWPSVAFLILMVPLPYRLEVAFSIPLQRFATVATNFTLQTLGFGSFAEGIVIRMGPGADERLNIAEACSGLSMLLGFVAIPAAVCILIPRRWYEKVLIMLSAVPIAVLANVLRLTMTGVILNGWGSASAEYFHDSLPAAGIMMGLALGLLVGELKLLNWIFIPKIEQEKSVMPLAKPAKPAPTLVGVVTQTPPAETKKETGIKAGDKQKVLPGLGLAVGPRPEPRASAPKGVQ